MNDIIIRLRRRSENWNVQTTIPPGAIDHRQGRRGQQLCPRPLHNRQGDRRPSAGQDQEVGRSVHRASRVFDIPFVWRWHRFRFRVTAHGTAKFRLRKKEQIGICHLPSASSEYQVPTYLYRPRACLSYNYNISWI